ncbi:MAG TPA: hypothetical protein PKH39_11490 [Woeseiaceae bacterium]|nr:hypothetical protein [Woeseiaceae bacterium]
MIYGSAFFLVALLALSLFLWRMSDRRRDAKAWGELIAVAGPPAGVFDASMVRDLPGPAQAFFRYTIAEGTPLYTATEIEMEGELGFGSQEKPDYKPMHARQVLAPPNGLVWQLKTGAFSGSDGLTPATSWTRFWLFGLLPVVRIGGLRDHHRSAFGRVIAEGAFWVPSSLLPGRLVEWEPVDESTARATVSYGDYRQAIDITVADDGQPLHVIIQRWSNENPDKTFREQPFGGYLSEFRDFSGFRLPTRVEGGNLIGTKDYFPFYKARVTDIRFPL